MIRKLKIIQYGGLRNREIEFGNGLNVIFGNNEAGKSTTLEALHAVLFTPVKLGNRKVEDKRFMERAFPYGQSDYAEIELSFEFNGQMYLLRKVWHLKTPEYVLYEGDLKIINPEEIDTIVKAYLNYGEGTYTHIFFAKQDVFNQIFESIQNSQPLSNSIRELLDSAEMKLDGISIEAFKSKLQEDYDALVSNWDIALDRPAGGRGIDRPHKRNVGKILESYYQMEHARHSMRDAEMGEESIERLQEEIKTLKSRLETVSESLTKLQLLENDLIQRERLGERLSRLEDQKQMLLKATQEWPTLQAELNFLMQSTEALKAQKEDLQRALEAHRAYEKYESAYKIYLKRQDLEEKIATVNKELFTVKAFNDALLNRSKDIESDLQKNALLIQSAELRGKLLQASTPITVVDYQGETQLFSAGETWALNAYMKVQTSDGTELEIMSNQIDYDSVSKAYQDAQKKQAELFKKVDVSNFDEIVAMHRRYKTLSIELDSMTKQLGNLPSIESPDLLLKQHEFYSESQIGDPEVLQKKLEKVQQELDSITAKQAKASYRFEKLQFEFKTYEALTMSFGQSLAEMQSVEKEFLALQEMPDEFSDFNHYRKTLLQLAEEKEVSIRTLGQKEMELERTYMNLPDQSAEAFKALAEESEMQMNKWINRAKKLTTIQFALNRVIEQVEADQASPLSVKFESYLRQLTGLAYDTFLFDDHMGLHVSHPEGEIPFHLLSSGTMESVSLAFRLALIETTDADGGHLCAFDDCLVNMDKSRLEKSISLLKEFSKGRQLLFFTCHETIAKQLSEKIIRL
ncbi:ATP-binding protein [Fusibacter tunisiensis]|uniref:Exonuclease SbcC n=1 Tax=Fusibacter tunisiensis TaxID=1008308 RepID=A0ABS2MTR1_9FIRM|nr:AAA family ATPase [Fusibacter tunisiensis]MBM7562652.1 exonuclease SbcC [Fusibacter tunisiensis]